MRGKRSSRQLRKFRNSLKISGFVSRHRWTDLIIGAPNFFDRKAEIGGAVYVYLNPFGHWDDQARPIRLNGTYDSMFGMTVSSVGDLDQDGYGGVCCEPLHMEKSLVCL